MKWYVIIGIGLVVIVGVVFSGVADRSTDPKTDEGDFDKFASIPLVDYNGFCNTSARIRRQGYRPCN